MRPRRHRLVPAAVAPALLAVIIAGCGSTAGATSSSSSSAPVHTTATASPTASTTTTTSTVLASPTATTAATSTSSGPAECANGQLAVVVGRESAAGGSGGLPIIFRNASSSTCTLAGYPGVALVNGAGRQQQVSRTPQGYLGGLSPGDKTDPVARLASGEMAAALLEGADHTRTAGLCPRFVALLITAPNQTETARVTRSISLCDPQIHPVLAGVTGRQSS